MYVIEQNGLYYPEHLALEVIEASQASLLAGTATIDDLYIWGHAGWKTPHDTYDSVDRFAGKALEEHQEFRAALKDYLHADVDDAEVLRGEAISELGDTVLSVTLLAINASVRLEPAVRQTITAYVAETTYIEDGQNVTEPWQTAARALLDKNDPLAIADVDGLIDEGFEPALSTHMTVYRDEDQASPTPEELTERAVWTIAFLSQAINQAERQFGWGEQFGFAGYLAPSPELHAQLADGIGKMTAQLYLEAAYMAKHGLQTTLGSTLQHTVKKISERIAANRIDKTDGTRTGHTI